MRPSLKVTFSGTSNQCSSSCRSVDKPRSNFRVVACVVMRVGVLVCQERLVVAKEKASVDSAQNAAVCSVCRTPVRDTPATNDNMPPPAVQAGACITSAQSYLTSQYTILPATRSTRPALTRQAGTVLDLPTPEGWKAELTWVVGWSCTKMIRLSTDSLPIVTLPCMEQLQWPRLMPKQLPNWGFLDSDPIIFKRMPYLLLLIAMFVDSQE